MTNPAKDSRRVALMLERKFPSSQQSCIPYNFFSYYKRHGRPPTPRLQMAKIRFEAEIVASSEPVLSSNIIFAVETGCERWNPPRTARAHTSPIALDSSALKRRTVPRAAIRPRPLKNVARRPSPAALKHVDASQRQPCETATIGEYRDSPPSAALEYRRISRVAV